MDVRPPWSATEDADQGTQDARRTPPESTDLRAWFPPVVDQAGVPICTAAVVTAFAGYLARRGRGEEFTASLLFNYRTSRKLDGRPDRPGSTLRWSLESWARYGLPEEERWPFRKELIDQDPPEEVFRSASALRGIRYGRIDGGGCVGTRYLDTLRHSLAVGIPVSLEFPLHPIQFTSFASGVIVLPPPGAKSLGVHVVTVMGYDDGFDVGSDRQRGEPMRGAFLVRNSWGVGWADEGYGWLPYEYVIRGLARESWYVVEESWKRVAS